MSSLEGMCLKRGTVEGKEKGDGEEERGGKVSIQGTWDQGGRESHHTQRRDSK
jgi:hypothetical protein